MGFMSRAGLEPATHWLKERTVRAVPEKRYDVLTSIQPLNRHPPKLVLGYLPTRLFATCSSFLC
jgi:hypothetical protein